MVRIARIPHAGCGLTRPSKRASCKAWRADGVRFVLRASVLVAAIFATALLGNVRTAFAQATPSAKGLVFGKNSGPVLPSTNVDKEAPLYLQGDKLIYDTDGDSVTARGNVEIYYNNYVLTADEVIYDQAAGTLTAVGNVELKEPNGNVIRADSYTLTDDFRDGFVKSLSVVSSDDTRIVARRAVRRDGQTTVFTDGKFTPCKTTDGKPPVWCLSAKRVIHDQAEATITYQDAQFEFLGVPIFGLPYFQHADPSVKRKSGFLPPQFGGSGDLGFFTEIPYYFALAPNYDFLFNPMVTTEQGVLFKGEFRHRLSNGQYNVKLAGIDQDGGQLNRNQDEFDGFRGSLETQGKFSLSSWWKAGWDVTLESDDAFRRFYKLDNILVTDRENRLYLRGQSLRNYFDVTFYQFGGLTFDDTQRAESRVHPVVDYNYVLDAPVIGGEINWDTNVVSLTRNETAIAGVEDQNLNRVSTNLAWRKKMIDSLGITYTPFAELRGDIVQADNVVDPVTNQIVENDTFTRGVASGGVTVSYPWIASTANASHTIEPIGQIIGRQASTRQEVLPNEDAQSLVFDDTNLFDTNKFSGYDRLETGTRANVGLQYTYQAFNGGYARFLAGQSYHISGDNAFADASLTGQITPISGLETDESDYVLAAYIAPFSGLKLISQSRFDQDDFSLQREDASLSLSAGFFQARAAYSFVEATSEIAEEQSEVRADLGFRLTNNWSVGGAIRYDIEDQFRLTDAFRVQYADDCFALTVAYTENFINDPERDIEPDRTVFVRFEFKHLGSFGYKTDPLGVSEQLRPDAG